MTDTYTIDPPKVDPLTLDERVKVLERATKAIIAGQDKQGEEFADFRDELRSHIGKLEELSDQLLTLIPCPSYGEVLTGGGENTHIRIQTTKNSKGYSFETVVA